MTEPQTLFDRDDELTEPERAALEVALKQGLDDLRERLQELDDMKTVSQETLQLVVSI